MKALKKVVLVLMTVCLLGSVMAPGAQAAGWLWAARITSAGAAGGGVYILLSDSTATPPVSNVWFVADATSQNAMLATALTAMSSGVTCTVYVSNTTQYSTLLNLYMQSQ